MIIHSPIQPPESQFWEDIGLFLRTLSLLEETYTKSIFPIISVSFLWQLEFNTIPSQQYLVIYWIIP